MKTAIIRGNLMSVFKTQKSKYVDVNVSGSIISIKIDDVMYNLLYPINKKLIITLYCDIRLDCYNDIYLQALMYSTE